ncbi:MAG: AmmeMemoRadiSam system protein A [Pseudomonadota bacterium]
MEKGLSARERLTLLKTARAAIAARLGADPPAVEAGGGSEALSSRSGAFVTLHKKGSLRGCIGRFTADGPLTDTVEEMAQAAAFEDPRFPSLTPAELDQIDLEISVLTPMTRVRDHEEIEVGRHGIYIIKGRNRGVLLPQVATERDWDRETFLRQTCLKAGLPQEAYKDPKTEIYIFSAEVFGEKDLA